MKPETVVTSDLRMHTNFMVNCRFDVLMVRVLLLAHIGTSLVVHNVQP